MIRVHRSDPPEVLDTTEKEQQLGEHFRDHPSTRPWRNEHILSQLFRDAHGKCVYCESSLGSIDGMQVDHFIPKTEVPLLAATWSNLNCSCGSCNQLKTVGHAYVNPYDQQPQDHFFYAASRLHAITEEGRATLKRLRLNQRFSHQHDVVWGGVQRLVSEMIEKLERLATQSDNPELKLDIWTDAMSILESGTPCKEYSAVVASQLVNYGEWAYAASLLRRFAIWDDQLGHLDAAMRQQALPNSRAI